MKDPQIVLLILLLFHMALVCSTSPVTPCENSWQWLASILSITSDERVTFWPQRIWSLPSVCTCLHCMWVWLCNGYTRANEQNTTKTHAQSSGRINQSQNVTLSSKAIKVQGFSLTSNCHGVLRSAPPHLATRHSSISNDILALSGTFICYPMKVA